jgi:hypothetical protein
LSPFSLVGCRTDSQCIFLHVQEKRTLYPCYQSIINIFAITNGESSCAPFLCSVRKKNSQRIYFFIFSNPRSVEEEKTNQHKDYAPTLCDENPYAHIHGQEVETENVERKQKHSFD